jgi:hypothetical protein
MDSSAQSGGILATQVQRANLFEISDRRQVSEERRSRPSLPVELAVCTRQVVLEDDLRSVLGA